MGWTVLIGKLPTICRLKRDSFLLFMNYNLIQQLPIREAVIYKKHLMRGHYIPSKKLALGLIRRQRVAIIVVVCKPFTSVSTGQLFIIHEYIFGYLYILGYLSLP